MSFAASNECANEVKQQIRVRWKSTLSRLYVPLLSIIGYMGRDPVALESFRQTHRSDRSRQVGILAQTLKEIQVFVSSSTTKPASMCI